MSSSSSSFHRERTRPSGRVIASIVSSSLFSLTEPPMEEPSMGEREEPTTEGLSPVPVSGFSVNMNEPVLLSYHQENARPTRATVSIAMSGLYSLTEPSVREPSIDGLSGDQPHTAEPEVASTASLIATKTTSTNTTSPTKTKTMETRRMARSENSNNSGTRKGRKGEEQDDDRPVSLRRSTARIMDPPQKKEQGKKLSQALIPGAVSVDDDVIDGAHRNMGSTTAARSLIAPAGEKKQLRLQDSDVAPIVMPGAVSVMPIREGQRQEEQQCYRQGTSMTLFRKKHGISSSLEHHQKHDLGYFSVDEPVPYPGISNRSSLGDGGASRHAAIMMAHAEEEECEQYPPEAIAVNRASHSSHGTTTMADIPGLSTLAAEDSILSGKERYSARGVSSGRRRDALQNNRDIMVTPSCPPSHAQDHATATDGILTEKLRHSNRMESNRISGSGSSGDLKLNLSQRSDNSKLNRSLKIKTEGKISLCNEMDGKDTKTMRSKELSYNHRHMEHQSSAALNMENTNDSSRSIQPAAAGEQVAPGALAIYLNPVDSDTTSVWTYGQEVDNGDASINESSSSAPRGRFGFSGDVEIASVEVMQKSKSETSCISVNKKWILLGVVVAILVGAIVGAVLGSSSGGSGEEKVLSSPTLSPTAAMTNPPSVAIETSTRWKNVILANSPDTTFNDPMSPQSLALDWMSTDQYSSMITNNVALLQRFALASLWYSTNGTAWSVSESWLDVGGNECSWQGITCNGSFVQALVVTDMNMVGTVPLELSLLRHLESLDLSLALLSGTIPTNLATLTKLDTIRLTNNRLSGTIPTELGQLPLLRIIGIDSNRLTGTIPSEILLLSGLTEFSARSNQLSGTIPFNGSLSNLETLWLTNNPKLAGGGIPSQLFELTSLTLLSLAQCRLGGTIPSEIGLLTKLTELDLSYNRLSGTFPTELVNAGYLDKVNTKGNMLTGRVPFQLCLVVPSIIIEIDCDAITCKVGCCFGNGMEKC